MKASFSQVCNINKTMTTTLQLQQQDVHFLSLEQHTPFSTLTTTRTSTAATPLTTNTTTSSKVLGELFTNKLIPFHAFPISSRKYLFSD